MSLVIMIESVGFGIFCYIFVVVLFSFFLIIGSRYATLMWIFFYTVDAYYLTSAVCNGQVGDELCSRI